MNAATGCRVFARLTKVDELKRLVYGRATEEILDRSREIFDYEGSKPYFEKWSAECHKDSGGKSLGNLRSMHQPVAAGKLDDITFLDAEKAIDVVAHVVDDAEWSKVLKGVYTGFSIGGGYVRKWNDKSDPTVKRYIASPSEISLVDRPCVPTAKFFDVLKADGSMVQKEFEAPADGTSGIAPYELEGQKKRKRAQKLVERVTLKKGMGGVAYFAGLIRDLEQFMEGQSYEQKAEGDDSKIPTKLRDAIQVLSRILAEMTLEESDELIEAGNMENPVAYVYRAFGMPENTEKATALLKSVGVSDEQIEALTKVGRRNSQKDLTHIQSMHDAACLLGALCANAADVGKVSTTTNDEGNTMDPLNKAAAPGVQGGAVSSPGDVTQSDNAEHDPKKGKSTGANPSGTTPANKASGADDDAETDDEKKERMDKRKAKKVAAMKADLGLGEQLTKADIATTVVETLALLGLVQLPAQKFDGAQPQLMAVPALAKAAPVLTAVGKTDDASAHNAAPAQDALAKGDKDPVALMKAVHARGPHETVRLTG